jgi:endonuclease G
VRQQVTNTFYDAQPRIGNKKVFHRGHLVAFENARWGDEPLQAGVDSFHFTNCAPQWGEFNAMDLWRNLEAWATARSSATGRSQKATMFSGCVFDAPLSSKPRPDELALETDPEDAAERWMLNLDGAAHPDLELADPLGEGVEGTVRVPKQFFKVLVWRQAGRLTVEAFILTQEGWLAALAPRRALREAAPALPSHLLVYQVDLRDLERLTGLDFGLSPRGLMDMAHRPPRLITSLEEIRP